jgi:DNA repair protein RecO (recombination protein O)
MPSTERSKRVEAVVLRHSDWGEADRILVLYTREMGKVRAIAKGVRKLRSRKAGHLEPFTRVTLQLAKGRDLWIVTQAETVEAYQPLREDLEGMGYAAYVVELIDRSSGEEGANLPLYRLLTDTLQRLAESDDPFQVVRYYELRLLDLLGFRPELKMCGNCGKAIQPEDQFFSAEVGGAMCPNCGKGVPGVRPMSMRTLKFLRHFQRSTYAEAMRVSLPDPVRPEMEAAIQSYLMYHLERKLNTPDFLKLVRKKNL